MQQIIREGKALVKIAKAEKISKEMPVFYNPVMGVNRSISVLLLKALNRKGIRIAEPLAASGVRGMRFLLELPKSAIKEVYFNDYMKNFRNVLDSNLKLNKIRKSSKIKISCKDANLFLLQSTGFDYIDIDPFGTPAPFLDSAVKRISREGILAVTATDTAALCGTSPKACMRRYWAKPLRNEMMHETGLRILIRKAQLVGAQYEKALIPVFSYSKDHYMRLFFRCVKGKKEADNVIRQHGIYAGAGPLWTGELWDSKVVDKMIKSCNDSAMLKFLKIIKEEAKIKTIGFYDIHRVCKKYKIHQMPKKQELISRIRKAGFRASETHFEPNGIKSDMGLKGLLKRLRKL